MSILFSLDNINAKIDSFLKYFERNWDNNYSKFTARHASWLNINFVNKSSSKGSKRKSYDECKKSTKYNRQNTAINSLVNSSPNAALDGMSKFAKMQGNVNLCRKKIVFSEKESFEFYKINQFSKREYSRVRNSSGTHEIYLKSYETLRKKLFTSINSDYKFSTGKKQVSINFERAFEILFARIIETTPFCKEQYEEIKFIAKMGIDGARSNLEIKFKNEADFDDSKIIIVSLVPLFLICDNQIF